ncbi:hypothetical protein R6Q59_013501 [Mikania micrantha]
MSNFVYKDLLLDRHSLSCQLQKQFYSLESRVSNLESKFSKSYPVNPLATLLFVRFVEGEMLANFSSIHEERDVVPGKTLDS